MSQVLIDGREARHIDYSDRGLQYGDGLFETISCRAGEPRWLELHLQRLRGGCERLRLPFEDYALLRAEIGALAQGAEPCLVKVVVTRGPARQRGYAPSGDERPTRIVSRHDWPPATAAATDGFRLGLSPVRLGINPRLAGLKHLNRLEQVLAQQQRDAAREDEVLMLSSAGQVIGGSMSNVFFSDQDGLYTPALNECGVAGVMRRVVLQAAGRLGLAVRERAVSVAELDGVREAFVTNVRWGLQSVRQLAGRELPGDALARSLWQGIDAAHP
ncbi:MAG TPA: aminodeoxychorismate lyase [Steroidobacteraceae bacterium]|jgi:4-amino-4-deoxychorismate lyase